MKLLFIGDIVGKPGRKAVRYFLPRLRESLDLDFVIANGENMAGGSGVTPSTANEVFESGVDVMTCGDHLWDKREVVSLLKNESRFVRPNNYPQDTPGQGFCILKKSNLPPIGVLNLQGQTFMRPIENPFYSAESAVNDLKKKTNPAPIAVKIQVNNPAQKACRIGLPKPIKNSSRAVAILSIIVFWRKY